MRILFDHGTPSGVAASLSGDEVTQAIERGWDRISNGELLNVAKVDIPFKKACSIGRSHPPPFLQII